MIDHFTKCSEEEEEPKRACYSLSKSTKEIRTPQQEKARNTQRKYNKKNDNKQTQYYFIPSHDQQLCQKKN